MGSFLAVTGAGGYTFALQDPFDTLHNAGGLSALIDASEDVREYDIKPVEMGSEDVPPGRYDVTYLNEGCQPITHGPYHVEAQ